jgi:phage-related tail fiber protein
VNNAVSRCPPGPVASTIKGVRNVTYRIKRISSRGLLPRSISLIVQFAASVNGRHLVDTKLAVYQVKGNVLSGVYTLGGGNLSAQQRVALHAAQESASNLSRM